MGRDYTKQATLAFVHIMNCHITLQLQFLFTKCHSDWDRPLKCEQLQDNWQHFVRWDALAVAQPLVPSIEIIASSSLHRPNGSWQNRPHTIMRAFQDRYPVYHNAQTTI